MVVEGRCMVGGVGWFDLGICHVSAFVLVSEDRYISRWIF